MTDPLFQSNAPDNLPDPADGPQLNALQRALVKRGPWITVVFNANASYNADLIAYADTHLTFVDGGTVCKYTATADQWAAFTADIARWEEIPF